MTSGTTTPRHRSGHRCRGARARPGRPAAADAAEAGCCPTRCAWADLHPAESIRDAVRFGDTPVPVAGPGAPLVAEFAWPSSRPRSGCPPRPARPTSVRPSSCGTGSRRPGPGSGPGTCRRGGPAGSPAQTIALSVAAAGFVDDQVAGFAHRIRPSGVDRLVEEAIVRFMPDRGPASPGGRRRRPARPRAHRTRCPSRAPCGSRPRSTSPTPWTSTPPSRSVPPGWPTSAPPRRWTCAAPKRSARWPGTSSPWTSTPDPDRAPAPARRQVVLHVHLSEDAITAPGRPSCTWPGWRTPARFVDADQVRAWCGRPGTR